jgi:hypothetical protein
MTKKKDLALIGSNRMEYLCLRNCYVGEVLRKGGKVYTLPAEMEKDPKNFRLVGETETEEAPQLAPEAASKEVAPDAPEKPREPKPGEYLCSKCKSIHREIGTSKIGKKHLKYKEV